MKLILSGCYKDFTGDFGVLSFVDGVSTRDVTELEGRRMGILTACMTEDGKNPLDHDVNWGGTGVPLSISPELTKITTVAEQQLIDARNNPEAPQPVIPQRWTRESLEAIADDKGIAGIREISDPLGLKGTSIKSLIEQILSGKMVVEDSNKG